MHAISLSMDSLVTLTGLLQDLLDLRLTSHDDAFYAMVSAIFENNIADTTVTMKQPPLPQPP